MSRDETLRQLTDAIVKGNNLATEQVVKQLVEKGGPVTATLDAITDGMSIVSDLHSIGEYDNSKFSASSQATLTALRELEPQLSIEESKAIGKAVLGCIPEDRVGLDSAMASSVLRAAGLKTFILPPEATYNNLVSIASLNQCHLAVLLIKTREDDPRVQSLASGLIENLPRNMLKVLVGGSPEPAKLCQKYGFTSYFRDLADLVSKATEIIIRERESR